MDANTVTSLIASVGFPIVMCGILCWYVYKVQTKLTDIVNENTSAIRELILKLDALKGGVDDGK